MQVAEQSAPNHHRGEQMQSLVTATRKPVPSERDRITSQLKTLSKGDLGEMVRILRGNFGVRVVVVRDRTANGPVPNMLALNAGEHADTGRYYTGWFRALPKQEHQLGMESCFIPAFARIVAGGSPTPPLHAENRIVLLHTTRPELILLQAYYALTTPQPTTYHGQSVDWLTRVRLEEKEAVATHQQRRMAMSDAEASKSQARIFNLRMDELDLTLRREIDGYRLLYENGELFGLSGTSRKNLLFNIDFNVTRLREALEERVERLISADAFLPAHREQVYSRLDAQRERLRADMTWCVAQGRLEMKHEGPGEK